MVSILSTLACALTLLSAPEAHLAPFSTPMGPGEATGATSIELTAARAEREHFYVRIVNDGEPRTLNSCDAIWRSGADVTTLVYRLEALPGAGSRPQRAPEALAPMPDSVVMAPGEAVDLLVALYVRPEATPGARVGELRLSFSTGKSLRCLIRLEILPFSLPPTPSLPVLFGLDQERIAGAAGLSADLDEWAPIYDAMAALRAGYAVWPRRRPRQEIFYDYSDLDLIKEHLTYVIRTATLPALELGGLPGELLAEWPPPVGNAPQDPLQLLLANIATHLQETGWQQPAVLIPSLPDERDDWARSRLALARVERAERLISRLLPGPMHPYFERYTDIWALPADTPPAGMSLLERGLSTIRYQQPALARLEGTPGALDPSETFTTAPGDALDGCEYTVWRAATDPNNEGGIHLSLAFEAVQYLEKIAVIRPPGGSPTLVSVATAFNPGMFSDATVTWETSAMLSEGGQEITLGHLKHPRNCRELRLTFEPASGQPVTVAEVLFNQDALTVQDASIEPVAPWLNARTAPRPYLEPAAATATLRLLPWFCWQRSFRGILGPVLDLVADGNIAPLATPTPLGLQPTVRLLHLLEGLEDYEYLVLYHGALRKDSITPPEHFKPGWVALPLSGRSEAAVNSALELVEEEREQIGRVLSGRPTVTRNFGP